MYLQEEVTAGAKVAFGDHVQGMAQMGNRMFLHVPHRNAEHRQVSPNSEDSI